MPVSPAGIRFRRRNRTANKTKEADDGSSSGWPSFLLTTYEIWFLVLRPLGPTVEIDGPNAISMKDLILYVVDKIPKK